jgi:CRP/FNR family transcriptional regulator
MDQEPKRPPYGGPAIFPPMLWDLGDLRGNLLRPEDIGRLAAISTVVRFKKGETIFREGDRADAVFNIISGMVKSYRTLANGSHNVLAFLVPNDLMGLVLYGKYVNSTAAVTPVTLYRIPAAALESKLRTDADLEYSFLAKACYYLHEVLCHAILRSKRHATAKMGLFLQMLEDRQANANAAEVYLPMTRSDIGSYAGITLDAVTRSLRELIDCGAVSTRDRRHFKIIDRQKLAAIISESRILGAGEDRVRAS